MKEQYTKPITEIYDFKAVDIVTVSSELPTEPTDDNDVSFGS